MIISRLTIALILIIVAAQAHAACEPDVEGPVQKIHLVSTQATCEDAQIFARELQKLSDQLGRSAQVTLVYGGRMKNAGFDDSRIIRIPHVFVHHGPRGEEVAGQSHQLNAIVAHEYGHALLSKIWRSEFKEDFEAIFNELDYSSEQTESAIISKEEVYPPKFLSSGDYQAYVKTMAPYSELYADVIAVYFYDDRSVMLNSLYFDEAHDWYFRYLELRDFSKTHKESYVGGFTDPHAKLALVRSYIGRELMPKNVQQKRKYLTWIEQAITQSVRDDIKVNKVPNTLEANKRLIHYLRKLKKSSKK